MPASFANPAVTNPTISTSNNRITSAGWTYDFAGNTLTDGNGQKFTYDGENKQTEVKNSSNVTLGEYWYDGDGRRVKKYVPATNETTIFVYDAGGKSIAEYSTVVESVEDAKVNYLTSDHLGSPRINTDRDGNVTSRHDYHPFGEEIITAQRTTGLGYDADTVRKQFTGYERDNEIGLDYAQARYYSNALGRFTSVDPLMASADVMNPQTLNRYGYVGNNPINLTDPTGEIWGISGTVVKWFDGALGEGFKEYNLLYAFRTDANGNLTTQMVALSSTVGIATNVASAAEWLAWEVAAGETAATLGAGAAALAGVPVAVATMALADILDPAGRYRTGLDLPEPVREFRGTQASYWNQFMNEMSKSKANESSQTSSQQGNPASADPNDPQNNRPTQSPSTAKDMKKLSPGETRKLGAKEDIHELKGGGGGKFDLYKDKQGNIYIVRIGGRGEPSPTNLNIKNY